LPALRYGDKRIRKIAGKELAISKLVEKINNYVIEKGFEGSLTNFVNTIVWSENYNYKIPYYWARECKKSGYDISEWVIEPNPDQS